MLFETPSYTFNIDEFNRRVERVRCLLPGIPLTYSIKANSFILPYIIHNIDYVEVCSPGELQICKAKGIPADKVIYSGVNKNDADIKEALLFGVKIITAESVKHIRILQKLCQELNICQEVLIRLTSGNQFGMSETDIDSVFSCNHGNLKIIGLHYYSGTQKKQRQICKDLSHLDTFLSELLDKYSYKPKLVEYGPGLAVDYFDNNDFSNELEEVKNSILAFSEKYSLGVEMGRYLAYSCGEYATKVSDIKLNDGIIYAILDGGIHHLKYYGQTMSMQIPKISIIDAASSQKKSYCLCGSLCTTADVLVRNVELPELKEDSIIVFHNCGAYSPTEGCNLFLSRKLPYVYITDDGGKLKIIREEKETFCLNC